MPSPLLQGGSRRRRRLLPQRDPWHPHRGRGRVVGWLLAAVAVIAAAGGGVWYIALRHSRHHTAQAEALRRPAHRRVRPRSAGPPGIQLTKQDAVTVHFGAPPRAAMLFDVDTGRTLWSLHPLERAPIASLTKIMSAIIIVDHTDPHARPPVTSEALHYQGQALGELPPHHRVPIKGLLAGMLLTSANDAAIDLADYVSGSDAAFAQLMNKRARQMGLRCSHFVSAYGLQKQNVSCAADLAALARIAMSKPRITSLARQPQARVPFPIKGGYLYVTSTNPLYADGYAGTVGLKTGFTDAAGRCLVGIVRRRGHTLGVVMLDSPDPATQAERLFNAAFRRHVY